MRHRWVQINGELIENGDQPAPEAKVFVRGDYAPYQSMATGEMIEGRRQHREHLRQHNLVEVGTEYDRKLPQRKPIPLPPLRETLTRVVNEKLRRR